MTILDFLTSLPAEEKDFFVNLLEETKSVDIAVRRTMRVLADSEPELARKLEGPVRDWLKINGPFTNKDVPDRPHETGNPGAIPLAPE